MLNKLRGFTIVEILIVVSVMGILLSIGVVSWGSYVGWSEDRARESDTRQWASTFDLYKSRYFVYPVMPTSAAAADAGIACLGAVNSFPTNTGASTGASKCGQFKSTNSLSFATATAAFDTAITKVGNMQKNSHEESGRTILDSTLVGPLVYVTRSTDTGTTRVTARFINFFKGDRPSGFVESANVAADFPMLSTLRPASGPGSSAKVYYIEKFFDYDL